MVKKARLELDSRTWVHCDFCPREFDTRVWHGTIDGKNICIHCQGNYRWAIPYVRFVESFAKDPCEEQTPDTDTEECGKCDPCLARKIVELHASLVQARRP